MSAALLHIGGCLGSCMGSMVFVENIVTKQPASMNLMTFSTFIFIAAIGLVFTVKFFTVKRQIPLRGYFLTVVVFFAVNLINNLALGYHVPVPLHIIFRSGSLLANLLLAMALGKRYSSRKYVSVIAITIGIVLCTLATHIQKTEGTAKKETTTAKEKAAEDVATSEYVIGVIMLSIALVMSAFLAICQENMYKRFGKHSQEAMFYVHALSLPLFLFFYADIWQSAKALTAAEPARLFSFELPISSLWLNMLGYCIMQYGCIAFVYRLNAEVDSLTVTLVVTLRKFLSLLVSIYFFENPFTPTHWLGAALVFAGTLAFADVWGGRPKEDSQKEKKKKQ